MWLIFFIELKKETVNQEFAKPCQGFEAGYWQIMRRIHCIFLHYLQKWPLKRHAIPALFMSEV